MKSNQRAFTALDEFHGMVLGTTESKFSRRTDCMAIFRIVPYINGVYKIEIRFIRKGRS